MITKITSANDLELFAPRFQQITEALAMVNPTVRSAVADAVAAKINLVISSEKVQNYLNEVISQQKVRTMNKDALMDGFASALVEHSLDSLMLLYADEIAAGTKTVAQVEEEALSEAEIEAASEMIEELAEVAVEKAQEVGLVVDSLETYFSNLDEIKTLATSQLEQGKFLLVMPADEPYFEIDANTRIINVPAAFKKNGVGVYGDHFAELIVFKIDRYFDSQDFMNTKIAINWNFTPAGSRVPAYESAQAQAAFAKDDELEPGYVVFGFFVTKEMTPSKGTLSFSVTCYNTDNDEISYSFNTQVAQVAINDGFTLLDPNEVKSVGNDFINRLSSSAYTPEGVSPIDDPVWQLGEQDEEEQYLGLPAELNFNIDADGVEDDTLTIVSQAYAPGLNTMKYTWYSAPENGTVEMLQEPDVVTRPSDYFVTTDLEPNEDSVYYIKDQNDKFVVVSGQDLTDAWENPAIDVYELGSSYDAITAGRYQVEAQASKITVRLNGTYIKTVSNKIQSNVCEVPPAAKPEVSIVVESALTPENTDFILENEDTPYKFISAQDYPVINAVVTSTNDQPLGAVALEALRSDDIADLDAETIAENTKSVENPDGRYDFSLLPASGEKQVNAEGLIAEGQYQVRAINRRNHTYSVSEPSEVVTTSFIAPKITKLNLYSVEDGVKTDVLVKGRRPEGVEAIDGVNLELSHINNYTRTFVFDLYEPEQEGDEPADPQYDDAVTSYFVEELIFDGDETFTLAINNPTDHNEGEAGTYDQFEVVYDSDFIDSFHGNDNQGAYVFQLKNDSGWFRIRTENRYHGTLRIGYTDVFKTSKI